MNQDPMLNLLLYRVGPCAECGLHRQLKLLDGRFVCIECNTKGE